MPRAKKKTATKAPVKDKPSLKLTDDGPLSLPSKEWIENAQAYLAVLYDSGYLSESKLPRKLALVFLLKACEVRVPPLQALKHFCILENGEVGVQSAELMRALIQRNGGKVIPVAGKWDDKRCVLSVERDGVGTEVEYTIEEATRQGLVRSWDERGISRRDMLFARCTTRAARALFADVISGLSYVEGEIPKRAVPVGRGQQASKEAPSPAESTPAKSEPSPPAPEKAEPQPEEPPAPKAALDVTVLTNSKTGEPRSLTQPIKLLGTSGEPVTKWSYGITADQIGAISQFAKRDREKHAFVTGWLKESGWDRFSALSEEEASEFIALMQFPERHPSERKPSPKDEQRLIRDAKNPLTWEEAYTEYTRVCQEIGWGDLQDRANTVLLMKISSDTGTPVDDLVMSQLDPYLILHTAEEIRRMAREEEVVLARAMEMAEQSLNAQPSMAE